MSRIYYITRIITTSIVLFLICLPLVTNARLLSTIDDPLYRIKRQSTEFKCKNGDSIGEIVPCDGYIDCPDGSDEIKEVCDSLLCPSYKFRCDYGACIDNNKLCDGVRDCLDNSDEYPDICPSTPSIKQKREIPNGFTCKNGESISSLFKCDGKADCQDASDETQDLCSDNSCFWNLFRCNYGGCILQDKMCDGQNDCVDNSDEEIGLCSSNGNQNFSLIARNKRQASCEFRCGSGECITMEQLCDGPADCKDGSDETSTQCAAVRCPSYLFRCKYGACIPKNQVCNGERNCADGSDEEGPNCVTSVNTNSCQNFEFRCDDGTCIDNQDLCDGIKNCPDGSDETEGSCSGLTCPTYLYRCAYGACIHKRSKCNGVSECADGSDEVGCGTAPPVTPTPTPPPVIPPSIGCLLPPHPSNGLYELSSRGTYKVNSLVSKSTIISLACNQGYVNSQSSFIAFCNTNKWDPVLTTATCIRTCNSLPSTDTYDVRCRLRGADVSCENPIDGTTAHLTCKPYYVFYGTREIPSCTDGNWDPTPVPCVPECGQKTINAETLVIGGSDSLQGEYPWMIAIYKTGSNGKEHICGGSIISRRYVLSAAHCFASTDGIPYAENLYTLVAGKYYRNFNISERGIQQKEVKRLYIHENYRGRLRKYGDDIALIEVDPFEMTPQVQLVCIDWDDRYEELDFREGNKAVVAGWGFTTEGSSPSEVLKKLIVPFQSTNTCKQYMDPDFFHQYYSTDKICAGYKDEGTSVCSGDSGGGLFFRSQQTRFFVRALVSLSPRSSTGCNSNHYALYTKVSQFLPWLVQITRRRL